MESNHEQPPGQSVTRQPSVSVVMPVYNGERYLAEAIASVLAQTHAELELIVVDDGSTDRTPAILAQFAARDPRLTVLTQVNQGQAAALNQGLAKATTAWVAIHDHDDVSLPQRLERQLGFLAGQPEARVVGTYGVQIDEQGHDLEPLETGPTSPEQFARIRSTNDWPILLHPSVMLHRPTILALGGYDPAFGPAADTELWSRVADEHLVLVLSERLVRYRMHSGSMTSTSYFEQREMLRWIKVREHARRSGQPPPSLKAHLAAQRSGLRRVQWINAKRQDATKYLLHRAKLARRGGRPLQRAAFILGASILAPRAAVQRLRYGYWLW